MNPMKRDEALAQLSRDHHQALYRALQLKRAGDAEAEQAVREMVEFFDGHGALHFRIEEDILLPAFVRDGGADPAADEIVRVLTDHVWIRARVSALRDAGEVSAEAANELGERLEAHVRHEERVLFPAMEAALSAEQLSRLGQAMDAAESESS
jgi:hemerythrin-like domain-containing protein